MGTVAEGSFVRISNRFVGVVFMTLPFMVVILMTVFDWMTLPVLFDIMDKPLPQDPVSLLFLKNLCVLTLPFLPLFCGGKMLHNGVLSVASLLLSILGIGCFAITMTYLFFCILATPGLSVSSEFMVAVFALICVLPATVLAGLLFVVSRASSFSVLRYCIPVPVLFPAYMLFRLALNNL